MLSDHPLGDIARYARTRSPRLAPGRKTDHAIGQCEAGGTVRDEQICSRTQHVPTIVQKIQLCLRVKHGSRFVENQNRRILEQRACEGDSLPLAAGLAYAVIADVGVISVGTCDDKSMRLREFRNLNNIRLSAIGTTVANIVANRPVEQKYILRHGCNLFTKSG